MRTCASDGHRDGRRLFRADRDAPFVAEADEAVPLGRFRDRASPTCDSTRFIEAATTTGAMPFILATDFCPRTPTFARACDVAGVTFIGPTPDAIAAMGSKIEAKQPDAQAAWRCSRTIGRQQSAERCSRRSEAARLPLLVKASAGGGGRGMRICARRSRAPPTLLGCRPARGPSAFGDETVVLEPYSTTAAYRSADLRRHARQHRPSARARMLDPAPASKDYRRGAIGRARRPPAGADVRRRQSASARRLATSTPARSSSLLAAAASFTSSKSTRVCKSSIRSPSASPGSTWCDCRSSSRKASRCRTKFGKTRSAAMRSKRGCTPKIHGMTIVPSIGVLHRFAFPRAPGVRVETGVADGSQISLLLRPDGRQGDRARAHAGRSGAKSWPPRLAAAQIHGLRTNRELLVRDAARMKNSWRGETDTHFLRAARAGRIWPRRWPTSTPNDCTPPRRPSPRRPSGERRHGAGAQRHPAGEQSARSFSRHVSRRREARSKSATPRSRRAELRVDGEPHK